MLLAIDGKSLELKTAAQDSAPKYQRVDGLIGGVCVDIMRALELVDPELQFNGYQRFMPFKRLQNDLEKGDLDVFCGLKKSPARAAKFIFIDQPLYQLNYTVAVRKADKVSINSIDELNQLAQDNELATVRGAATQTFLRNNFSAQFVDTLSTPAKLVKVLESGRVRFAFYHDMGLREAIASSNMDSSLKVLPVSFSSYTHHLAFSQRVDQTVINKVQAALTKLILSGELPSILSKYNLRLETGAPAGN